MNTDAATRTGPFDGIARDLQQLRLDAGDVSYAEVAARIASNRAAAGATAAAARIARSTVFDAFRLGRRRINPDLVAEIVIALCEDADAADYWRGRCVDARRILSNGPLPNGPPPNGSLPNGPPCLGAPRNERRGRNRRRRTCLRRTCRRQSLQAPATYSTPNCPSTSHKRPPGEARTRKRYGPPSSSRCSSGASA
ncbi:MAG: hypothetical protein WDA07_02615 [Leucobacter sp.]